MTLKCCFFFSQGIIQQSNDAVVVSTGTANTTCFFSTFNSNKNC